MRGPALTRTAQIRMTAGQSAPGAWLSRWPLDGESIYARFLADRGGGVHHIAVAARNFDEMLAMDAQRGIDVPLNG
jgi:hypothetical protein